MILRVRRYPKNDPIPMEYIRVMYGPWWPCQEDGLIYEKRDKAIIVGSIVFLIFSTIDGALTLWGLSIGAIEEVN